jgi:hypothetical protein
MTAPLFLAFVALVAAALIAAAARYLSARAALRLGAGLAIWLTYVGALSYSGIVGDATRRPPGILFILLPVFAFMIFAVVRSPVAGRVARTLPLPLLIGGQAFRVGVELFLHQLWLDGLVPKMLTFEGANVDIWIGLSAPLVAFAATRGRWGRRAALAWSAVGLTALANVAIRSALTAPGSLHLLTVEVPNLAIGAFPYTYIAGFLAPLAVALHVLAIRNLMSRSDLRKPATAALAA